MRVKLTVKKKYKYYEKIIKRFNYDVGEMEEKDNKCLNETKYYKNHIKSSKVIKLTYPLQ